MIARKIISLCAFALLGLAATAGAVSGPEHRSFRPLAMGNAFVAVVDDKDAMYYNPAGLTLINRLGSKYLRPNQANYPRNRIDARLNAVGVAVPLEEYRPFWDFFQKHQKSLQSLDSALNDSTLRRDLLGINRKSVPMGLLNGAEFAMNDYGAAVWTDAVISPYLDIGLALPHPAIEEITLDAVIQVATARNFLRDKLAVGVGLSLASRQQVREIKVNSTDIMSDSSRAVFIESLRDTLTQRLLNLGDVSTYGYGVDIGVLWQQTSWLRFGAAIQNVGMVLNGKQITPELTAGLAVTVPLLSTGGVFARKVNIAVDMEDLLNDERNYKPMSKLNFGGEIEQYGWHFFSVRASGGFKGGYWTAGAGLSLLDWVHVNAVTWGDEAGYYTGQLENRLYAVEVSVGL